MITKLAGGTLFRRYTQLSKSHVGTQWDSSAAATAAWQQMLRPCKEACGSCHAVLASRFCWPGAGFHPVKEMNSREKSYK